MQNHKQLENLDAIRVNGSMDIKAEKFLTEPF